MANHRGDEGFLLAGSNFIAELRAWNINVSVNMIEGTRLSGSWKSKKAGTREWNGSIDTYWDENDPHGQGVLKEGEDVTLYFAPEGEGAGDTYYKGSAIITGITRQATLGGMVEASYTFEGNGALTEDVAPITSIHDGSIWTQATASANWTSRIRHNSVVFQNKMWLLGGRSVSFYKNDVWHSTNGIDWTEATSSAGWVGRNQHATLVFNNKLWVLGGYISGSAVNDVWSSSDGVNWTLEKANADWPARNAHGATVFDGKMYIVGGQGAGGYGDDLSDVWSSSNGVNWTLETSNPTWAGLYGATVVTHAHKMWLIGGNLPKRNDVYSSANGKDWVLATDNAPWQARHYHASVVYHNKIWVLGGDPGPRANDVWFSSDGANWTQATSAAAWPARRIHSSVVYDDKIWVIGGDDVNNVILGDVWHTSPTP